MKDVKAIALPCELKGYVNGAKVREAVKEIAECDVEKDKVYHYAFRCPEGLFEKAKQNAKARRVSLSYWISEILSAED